MQMKNFILINLKLNLPDDFDEKILKKLKKLFEKI